MPLMSLRNTLFIIGSAILACNDSLELIASVSEFDPIPLLIYALGFALDKYPSIIKSKEKVV